MARSIFVYVTYIRTTPEKLWSALTDAEYMKQYWFGVHCESQWTAGSSWKMVSGDGKILDDGEIVAAEPPRRLVISNLKSLLETGSIALQNAYPPVNQR
jgi:uncharacterized protein YndB with AHSA1/START domain